MIGEPDVMTAIAARTVRAALNAEALLPGFESLKKALEARMLPRFAISSVIISDR